MSVVCLLFLERNTKSDRPFLHFLFWCSLLSVPFSLFYPRFLWRVATGLERELRGATVPPGGRVDDATALKSGLDAGVLGRIVLDYCVLDGRDVWGYWRGG